MLNITITSAGLPEFAAKLDEIRRRCGKPGDACLVWAEAVAKKARTTARNKGGETSFWRDQAKQVVAHEAGPSGAAVHVNYIGAHWQTGGDIFPKRARCLTIPISEEAKGKRAGEFEMGGRPLFTIPSKSGDPDTVGILGYAEEEGGFHPLYALRARARQQPDKWFPEEPEIMAIGRVELQRFADRLAGGAA